MSEENPLQTIVLAGVGELAGCFALSTSSITHSVINNGQFQAGDPLTGCLVAIATALLMQFKNILKKPLIRLRTILASAILGPVSA